MQTHSSVPAQAITLYVELVSSAQADETPSPARDFLSVVANYMDKNQNADALVALQQLPELLVAAGVINIFTAVAEKNDLPAITQLLLSSFQSSLPANLSAPLSQTLAKQISPLLRTDDSLRLVLLLANSTQSQPPAIAGLEATLTRTAAPPTDNNLPTANVTLTFNVDLVTYQWLSNSTATAQSFGKDMRAQGQYLDLTGTSNFVQIIC
ncbi:hypothetical protein [Pseudomonas sp. MWU16-30317]|uniref:hypothetical protein n=1 Tax=Pseudomonas sp. MWU16-30317 TaxID=2878095 RepID=UPI001CFA14EE|nr:hypothetical protein [Pseudomonas sp. MWU16-30317]